MVILDYAAPQKTRIALPRNKVIINWPVLWRSFTCINPILSNACGKNRVFYIEKKYSVLFQSPMHFLKYPFNIFNIVQNQIRDDTIPSVFRIFIFFYPANAIFNLIFSAAFGCLLDHFPAQIEPQYVRCSLLCCKLTMPAIAAP